MRVSADIVFEVVVWSDVLGRNLAVSDLPLVANHLGDELTDSSFYLDNPTLVIRAGDRVIFDQETFSPIDLYERLVSSSSLWLGSSTLVCPAEHSACWIFASDGESVSLCLAPYSAYLSVFGLTEDDLFLPERSAAEAAEDQGKDLILAETDLSLAQIAEDHRVYGCIRMDVRSWLRGLARVGQSSILILEFALQHSVEDKAALAERVERLQRGVEELERLDSEMGEPADSSWFEGSGWAAQGALEPPQLPDATLRFDGEEGADEGTKR